MQDNILEVKNLRKVFHERNGAVVEAVKDISFSVERGKIFGFLGPNGAGKSTTIAMLTTQLQSDGEEILLDGQSVKRQIRLPRGQKSAWSPSTTIWTAA